MEAITDIRTITAVAIVAVLTTMNFFKKKEAPTSTAPTPIYALNGKLVIKPERRDDFLKIILNDREQTLKTEPGAIQFVVGECTETPNTFYLHEEYQSQSDFDHHCTTKHFDEFKKFLEEEPLVSEPVLEFYTILDSNTPTKQIPVPPPSFCVNVKLQVKPESREEFFKIIRGNRDGCVNDEPLGQQFVVGESTTEPNTFYLHEQYSGKEDGKEGFDAHKLTTHYTTFSKFSWSGKAWTELPVGQKFITLA